jgi:hypothetical protein
LKEIQGYKITGVNIKRIFNILDKAREAVREMETEVYNKLLAIEITELVDDVSTRSIQRPEIPIIDAAIGILNEKIRFAGMGADTEYNLEVSANVLTDGKDTYIILRAKNKELIEAFEGSSPEILDYSVEAPKNYILGDEPKPTAITKKWNELRDRYGDNLMLTAASVILSGPVQVDMARLYFASPAERATTRARRAVANRLLSLYAGGKEIPPYKLMEYMENAFAALLSEESEYAIKEAESRLITILPNITLDMIKLDPRAPILTEPEKPDEAESAPTEASAEE